MAQIVGVHISGYQVGQKVDIHQNALPFGTLAADGSAISRTVYSKLFAKIGTTYGSGDGSTTFNIPDHRGRSPLGAGTGAGLSGRSLGQSFGEESHQLALSEMPNHSHGGVTGTENQGFYHNYLGIQLNGQNGGVDGGYGGGAFGLGSYVTRTTGPQNQNHNHNIGPEGGNGPHNVLHPVLVVKVCVAYV